MNLNLMGKTSILVKESNACTLNEKRCMQKINKQRMKDFHGVGLHTRRKKK